MVLAKGTERSLFRFRSLDGPSIVFGFRLRKHYEVWLTNTDRSEHRF
jgi:hypothetical protein